MARTAFQSLKFVRDIGCASHWVLIKAPGQWEDGDNLGKSSILYIIMVYWMYSLESLRVGDSTEYTQNTISWWKKKISPNICYLEQSEEFRKDSKHEFELAMVNEPSKFELLMFDYWFRSQPVWKCFTSLVTFTFGRSRWLSWMRRRPGGRGFNPRRGRQHSFVEIDHEIFSTAIPSADSRRAVVSFWRKNVHNTG